MCPLAVWWGLRSPNYNNNNNFVIVWTDGNTTITLPIILVGCGPALPPNPPQDDPAPIPPPKGGGSGREPQIKIIWRRKPPDDFLKMGVFR